MSEEDDHGHAGAQRRRHAQVASRDGARPRAQTQHQACLDTPAVRRMIDKVAYLVQVL